MAAGSFNEILSNGTTTSNHPDFSSAGGPIQCGFYTANSTPYGADRDEAGYDNWKCVITTPPGLLKICKVAGAGVAVGTPFTFTVGSNTLPPVPAGPVPAGPGPGGTCVIGPSLPAGTTATVTETPISGYAVSSITVAPPGQLVGTPDLAKGSVNITIGSGVTEVTYTDQAPTGYLEICKKGDLGGKPPSFKFIVNPGNLGPFTVPVGSCSPAIEVAAGQVVITELPTPHIRMYKCDTIPVTQQVLPCDLIHQKSTVIVAPGDVSTQTIANIWNRRGP